MGDMAYFPAYFSYARTLAGLTDEQFGHVMRAAIAYAEEGTIPELDPLETMGFAFIKEDIDRANERYKNVCEANKRNAQKRWKAKAESADHATACDRIPSHTDVSDRTNAYADHATACDRCQSKSKGKSKSNSNSKGESTENASDDADAPAQKKSKKKEFVPPTVDEVAAYCKDKGLNTIDPEYFVRFYSESDWTKANGKPVQNWKSTVLTWAQRDKERGITAKPEPKPAETSAETSFDTEDFFDAALQRTYGDNWKFFKEGSEQG